MTTRLTRLRGVYSLAALGMALGFTQGFLQAAPSERSVQEVFPSSTVVYVEIAQPKDLVRFATEGRFRGELETSGLYQLLTSNKGYQEFLSVVEVIEERTGLDWRPTVESISAGGVYLGIDSETSGIALLVKSEDAGKLATVVDTIVGLARADASNKGAADPLPSRYYREIETIKAREGGFAVVDEWFVYVNKGELGRVIIDNLLDGGGETLSSSKTFQEARTGKGSPSVWAYCDLGTVREAGLAAKMFTGKTDNPGAELLLGGIAEALKKTTHVTGALNLADDDRLSLSLAIPHDPASVSESREFYFGSKAKGVAEKPIPAKETLLALTTYRDISGMWLAADELFDENQAAKLTQMESTLGLFFSGRDFVSDVLGQLSPQVQLVVARQDYKAVGGPAPTVKYPAGALVLRTKDSDAMQRFLRISFQTFVGFINTQGNQAGRAPFELKSSEQDGATIQSAEYYYDKGEENGTDAETYFNFSPSLAQLGEYVVLSSTRQLATNLIDSIAKLKAPETIDSNTRLQMDAKVLSRVLSDNLQQLIASNQLKKGQTEAEATGEIKGILSLLGMFRDAALNLKTGNGELGLSLELGIANDDE